MQDKEKEKYYEEQDRDLQRYFNEINEIPLLTREEEICLASEIKEGRIDALRKLVEANLRFVVTVAKAYQDRGLPLSDLIMEGNLGLIEAAKRYDAERGIKFISYAVWWIKQSILKALAKHSRTVRMPLSQVWNFQKISKTFGELEQTIGREPTLEEVAKELNSTPTEVSQTIGKWRREVFLEEAIERTDDELRLIDKVINEESLPPDNSLLKESLKSEVQSVLDSLPEREAEVVRLYFGIDNSRPLTLMEIGGRMKLSRERVRQLKNRAIKRLRHVSRRERLRPFLG